MTDGMDSEAMRARVSSATDRPKLLQGLFVAQFMLSFGYAAVLYGLGIYHADLIESVAQKFSPLSRVCAPLLPIVGYASSIENPRIGLSAALIGHLFSVLMMINTAIGIPCFLFRKRLSYAYAVLLRENKSAFDAGIRLYLFVVATSIYLLFLEPIFSSRSWLLAGRFSLFDYFVGSVCPVLLFYCLLQAMAMHRARAQSRSTLRG
jgi:hypothetical protein